MTENNRMQKEQPYFLEPGNDARIIVQEMLDNDESPHWHECIQFVTNRIKEKAITEQISPESQQEIIQDIMLKVVRYLTYYRFESSFKSWLHTIILNCTYDKHRDEKYHQPQYEIGLSHFLTNTSGDQESQEILLVHTISTDEIFEMRNDIVSGISAIFEYAHTHANPERNSLILRLVIIEGKTYEETAKVARCNPAVVGYVVREAQRYAHKKVM